MIARRGVALCLGLVLVSFGCLPGLGKPPAPPPRTQATALREPSTLLPRDLDVVVRVDVAKIRATLGDAAAGRLAEQGLPGGERALATMMATKATAVWVGLRGSAGDSVLVAKGEVNDLDPDAWAGGAAKTPSVTSATTAAGPTPPSTYARLPATEPGITWFERRERAKRADPARLVLLATGVLAAISPGEIDAVDRIVRVGGDPERLRPREDAVLSFAIRGRVLRTDLAPRFPEIADILTTSTGAEGSVDLVGGEVRAELSLTFAESADADRGQAGLERLVLDLRRDKGRRVSTLARGTAVARASKDTVSLRITLPGDEARIVLGAGPGLGAAPVPSPVAPPVEPNRGRDPEGKREQKP